MYRRAVWKAQALAPVTAASIILLGSISPFHHQYDGSCKTLAEAAPEDSERLAFWKNRWETASTGWHKTTVNPLLQKFVETHLLTNNSKNHDGARVLVPLCGKSVDLAFLASREGVATVVGVEVVRRALEEFTKEQPHLSIREVAKTELLFDKWIGHQIVLLKGDFFALNAQTAGGKFDGVWDRAALVAVSPSVRSDYVKVLGDVIAPGGVILLVTYVRPDGDTEKGPPFSIDEGEVRRLFEGLPWVQSIECVDSQLAIWNEPWYRAIFIYFRLGNVTEKAFVIKAK